MSQFHTRMRGYLGLGPGSGSTMILAVAIILLSHFTPVALGLATTSGSPCESVCHQSGTNTTSSDIVCVDQWYNTTTKGTNFQDCVECQLKSDYADPESGESDVDWGLYNLRYAFTSCVFGYPHNVDNISSPCVVSCQSLEGALNADLVDPDENDFYNFCGSTAFADNVVDTCEFCYNLTDNQVYLANFLEATRYNCHFRTASGTAFDISPTRIFTESLLPSTLGFSSSSHGLKNLAIIIALPVLAFVILVCSLAFCCFFFIRWRRRQARQRRQSDHLHARWHDTSITTPIQANWGEFGGYGEYHDQQPQPQHGMYGPAMYPGGYGPGFGFVDNDGKAQDVGYSKSTYIEPGVAVSSAGPSPDHEKENPTHFHAQTQ